MHAIYNVLAGTGCQEAQVAMQSFNHVQLKTIKFTSFYQETDHAFCSHKLAQNVHVNLVYLQPMRLAQGHTPKQIFPSCYVPLSHVHNPYSMAETSCCV